MAHYISGMPLWAIVSFILGFFLWIVFIARSFGQAAISAGMSVQRSRNINLGILFFFTAFFVYVQALCLYGVLDRTTMPPMVILCTALPLTIFLFGYVGNTALYTELLRAITMESLITIHVYRLIGFYFFLLYFYHLLPAGFAISAGTGDVLTAIFALPVARIYAQGRSWRIPAVIAWNILGIMDIVCLFISLILVIRHSLAAGVIPRIRELDLFPFSFFAAFAPPVLMFLHVMVFKKINQLKGK